MLQTMFRFPLERIKEAFHDFRSKHFNENHSPPLTFIGIDYPWAYPHHHVPAAEYQESPAAIQKYLKDDYNIVPYGPFYRASDKQMWKKLKDTAWKHVLETTGGNEKETTRVYFEAVQSVEDDSRELYASDESIDNISSEEYIRMMVVDGCFLLQVALSVLGGSKQLVHLRDFPLLVEGQADQRTTMIRVAVSSMFVVGNQIPLMVLKVLMRQSFFKNFISRGMWEQPSDLERWVLFELLLVPIFHARAVEAIIIPTAAMPNHPLLGKKRGDKPLSIFGHSGKEAVRFIKSFKPLSAWRRQKKYPSEKAKDLLHGLWLLVMGLAHSHENNGGEDDVEEGIQRDDTHSSYDVVLPTVRSAKELKVVGVDFQYKEGTRINGIRFRNNMFNASLFLPRISVVNEKETNMLFNNLIRYEVIHFQVRNRKVCEYLQLMRELVRSPEDVKVLAADGIIVVDPILEEKVPVIFKELDNIPSLMRSHRSSINSLRGELNSYTRPSPFKKLGDVLSLVVFLTLIQTVFSVISYVFPRN